MRAYRRGNLTGPIGGFALSAAAIISGCTMTMTFPLEATIDRPPSVTPVPLAVGVYYSPEFRAYEHVRVRQKMRFVAPFGQASVALFDRVLPMIFEGVVPVASPPPLGEGGPKLAAVIEPKIEAFDFDWPVVLAFGAYTAEVTYRFTLYSPEGNPFASWTVRGDGNPVGLQAGVPKAIDLAMEDAAKKFMAGFRDVPEVRRWLRQAGIPDAQ